jgi:hypothetical protein
VILKNDKKQTCCIITVNGELKIRSTILRPKDKASLIKLLEMEKVKSVVPLDRILRIDDLPFKMTREMMCEVAFWGQNQASYKSASEVITKVHRISISSETVRQVTDFVGHLVFKKDEREANIAYERLIDIKHTNTKEGVFYIQTDGASINTRIEDDDGSTWRENKLGIVFSSDNVRKSVNKKGESTSKILKKEYTSYVGSVQEFKKHLFSCALRNGYGEYKVTIIISDGAKWIRTMAEELFPDAILILDLFHLCENTYTYAKAIFRNDESRYVPWADDIIQKLKNGEKHEVLQILARLKNRKIPKGTVNLHTYVINNFDRIDYKLYEEKGYYVGSGAIESGNKVVLQKRMKLAGMRWSETPAQHVLSLRAKYESGLWKTGVLPVIMQHVFK